MPQVEILPAIGLQVRTYNRHLNLCLTRWVRSRRAGRVIASPADRCSRVIASPAHRRGRATGGEEDKEHRHRRHGVEHKQKPKSADAVEEC